MDWKIFWLILIILSIVGIFTFGIIGAIKSTTEKVKVSCYDKLGNKIIGVECEEYKTIFPKPYSTLAWLFGGLYIISLIGASIHGNMENGY